MNCHTAQNLMSAFIDCELDAELKREIRKHLFSCPDCQVVFEELQNVKNCLENLEEPLLPLEPLNDLFARIKTEKYALIQRPFLIMWGPRMLVTAACVGLFFLTALTLFPLTPKTASLANQPQLNDHSDSRRGYDRNFSFDQSVTVYQASAILP
jgi:anti-sigma factor RsiW